MRNYAWFEMMSKMLDIGIASQSEIKLLAKLSDAFCECNDRPFRLHEAMTIVSENADVTEFVWFSGDNASTISSKTFMLMNIVISGSPRSDQLVK